MGQACLGSLLTNLHLHPTVSADAGQKFVHVCLEPPYFSHNSLPSYPLPSQQYQLCINYRLASSRIYPNVAEFSLQCWVRWTRFFELNECSGHVAAVRRLVVRN